jgi:hypothetical protein
MSYIVIEKFGGPQYSIIVTDVDGFTMVFESEKEAQREADDCQDAIIVEID